MAKPKPTKYNKNGGVLGELGNFFKDYGRNVYNAPSDIGRAISGKKMPRSGDMAFGTATKKKVAKAPVKKAAPAKKKAVQTDLPVEQWQDPVKSFEEYMNRARGMVPSIDFSAQRNQLKSNAASGDARLNAMYQQLQNSYNADAPKLQGYYDTSAAEQKKAADEAAATTAQGYNQARQAQTQQFQQLGIPEAAGVLAANGANAARDQSVANSEIAKSRNINAQQTSSNKASALTYNTKVAQAAGAEGNSQRATLQRTLAQKLADIESQQQQANASQQSNVMSLAQALGDWDNAAAQRRGAANDPMAQLNLQALAAKVQAQTLANQKDAAAMNGGSSLSFAQAQQEAIAAGVDPKDAAAMDTYIKMRLNLSKIKQ
jgi:hypothetical protein